MGFRSSTCAFGVRPGLLEYDVALQIFTWLFGVRRDLSEFDVGEIDNSMSEFGF